MVITLAHAQRTQLVAQEVEVNDEDIIQQLMEHSNANRSTGSTGANSESSRSHSIMQVSQGMPLSSSAASNRVCKWKRFCAIATFNQD